MPLPPRIDTGIYNRSTAFPLLLSLLYLRQHRIMEAADFGGSFAPIVQYEKWEIHPVFPHFSYFRLRQNLSPNFLAPLCGVALISSTGFPRRGIQVRLKNFT